MQREDDKKMQEIFLTSEDICRRFSVSMATIRNWVRLGRLSPAEPPSPGTRADYKHMRFAAEQVSAIEDAVNKADGGLLKTRRNKSRKKGRQASSNYLPQDSPNASAVLELVDEIKAAEKDEFRLMQEELNMILAEWALRLIRSREEPGAEAEDGESLLAAYLTGQLKLPARGGLILDLLMAAIKEPASEGEERNIADFRESSSERGERIKRDCMEPASKWRDLLGDHPEFFSHAVVYRPGEDTLGCLYQALSDLKDRKAGGSYYTFPELAREVIKAAFESEKNYSCILDPCCGSGQFLINLPESIPLSVIYGADLDPVAAALARINLGLRFPESTEKELAESIRWTNSLDREESVEKEPKPDLILGNPPWGAAMDEEVTDRLRLRYLWQDGLSFLPEGKLDSADLFVQDAISRLKPGGEMHFLLPESILHVRQKRWIRCSIADKCRIIGVDYLGSCFEKVQCPVICLSLRKERSGEDADPHKEPVLHTQGIKVRRIKAGRRWKAAGDKNQNQNQDQIQDQEETFIIRQDRCLSPERFAFLLRDEEWELARKIRRLEGAAMLEGKADFALGIVTGDNRALLLDEPEEGAEPIRLGSDIYRAYLKEPSHWLRFDPGALQQTAPEAFYRAKEKLVYRFVCNAPAFAIDREGCLTLNSANILIPHLDGVSMESLAAILNSRIITWLYRKELTSVKMLRSHLENFPIPGLSQEQDEELTRLMRELEATRGEERRAAYEAIDGRVNELYHLSAQEIALVQEQDKGRIPFLSLDGD